ncbi:sensor histidine kinase [Alloscardovia sp. HMSC034E08]|uniref:sensor histidine kinase n=1 Tax=Alloscardovia sp. HMSC034E08 TaxID=1739413 RepID=UPI0008BB9819|nr:HAMP domain-containing sensor histidine kinase [Alloscardovia sp. HMSC034E08]OFQ99414.1 hypothetical protein HMPREF2909_06785 [Alloscardovia sp. HMSC034E08]
MRTHSLERRVFTALLTLALSVFLLTAASLVMLSWTAYERTAENELHIDATRYAQVLRARDAASARAIISALPNTATRYTLIDGDGTVLADTSVPATSLDNHNGREEIAAAREHGSAVVIRHSHTLREDSMYAAALVPGTSLVIRAAQTRTSLASYSLSLAPMLVLIAVGVVALSIVAARLLTRRIVRPLRRIDLRKPLDNVPYHEMRPLLERVDEQRLELLARNERLEQTANLRREFTSNVSHDMKSPLQVIGGYAELIEQGVAKPEDIPRFAGIIRTEAASMRTLIDNVLTLSQLDEGGHWTLSAIDIAPICERVIERLHTKARERGVRVNLQAEHVRALGSAQLAEQVLYNLIDNAIQHGKENGTVDVAVRKTGEKVVITVCDDGPGVPAELRSRIFERFYRADAARSRTHGNTGLGLAIAKHDCATMRGHIDVSDSPTGGACFAVTLNAVA